MQLRDDFRTIASYWSKRGPQVGLAIGVAAGFATVGVIGAGDHIGYRAIGRTVNVAGRLCGAALDGQILTNQQVADRAIGIALQPHDDVSSLRGIQRPTKVFRVA